MMSNILFGVAVVVVASPTQRASFVSQSVIQPGSQPASQPDRRIQSEESVMPLQCCCAIGAVAVAASSTEAAAAAVAVAVAARCSL